MDVTFQHNVDSLRQFVWKIRYLHLSKARMFGRLVQAIFYIVSHIAVKVESKLGPSVHFNDVFPVIDSGGEVVRVGGDDGVPDPEGGAPRRVPARGTITGRTLEE